MKTLLLTCAILFLVININAQSPKSFQVLNPIVQQGGILIIQIAPQWMPPATSNPTIFIFGNNYKPNANGKVVIGVSMNFPHGSYGATFNENSLRSGWDIEVIEVVENSFEKTRISSFTGTPNPRTGLQKQKIDAVFGLKNQAEPDLTGGLGYIDPLGMARDVIDPFGYIYENNPHRSHDGVDLRAPVGTPVRSVNNGRVVLVAKKFRTEGNVLIINHGLGIFSVYMHLSKFHVKEGDMVYRNEVIALSGRSGAGVKEPHLHFNIKIRDTYVDPLIFIDTINQYLK